MYLQYFGFDSDPFLNTPDTDRFYPGGQRKAILEALIYAIGKGEGILKVVGEVGTGKTTLCRMLLKRLPPPMESAFLINPRLEPQDLPLAIATELKAELPLDKGRFLGLHAIQELLMARFSQGHQVVVMVEEAQAMSLETLEEIRLLSNLETGQHKLLQIVLFGQPELDAALARKEMRQLRERIAHHFHLDPLTVDEVREYLTFRVRAAGYRGDALFSRGAIKGLHRYSHGLSRRINFMADKALLAAFLEKSEQVSHAHVRAAARDCGLIGATSRRAAWLAGALLVVLLGGGAYVMPESWRSLAFWEQDAIVAAPPVAAPPVAAPAAVPEKTEMKVSRTVAAPVAAPPVEHAPPPPLISPPPSEELPLRGASSAVKGESPVQGESPAAVAKGEGYPLLARRLTATEAWVKGPARPAFTLQVLTSARESGVEGLLKELSPEEREHVHVRSLTMGNRAMIILYYGGYADIPAARAGMAQLPAALSGKSPFVLNTALVP